MSFAREEGIVDVHVHPLPLLPEDVLINELNAANVDICVLLAIDVDTHYIDEPKFRMQLMQRLIDVGVWDVNVLNYMKTLISLAKTTNERVADLIRRYSQRFIGFGSINVSKGLSYVSDKLDEIDKLNLAGIKLIPTLQFFNPSQSMDELKLIFEFCSKNAKKVMFHTGCDPGIWEIPEVSEDANPKYLESIIKDYEDVPVILAHAGSYSLRFPGIWLNEALKLGKKYDNVWFDISAVIYLVTERKFVDKIRSEIGMMKVLFGSDYPVIKGYSIKSMVDEIKKSKYLSNEEKSNVLKLNAIRLFNL